MHGRPEDEIKHLLPHTYFAFFSRFGRLRPIQIQAIPVILEGVHTLVVSPAASGKTEAVICPVIERRIQEQWPPLSILYVTPTRALVNDLYARIRPPLETLGYSVRRKTQDHPEFKPERPPDVLITTPESFDSLMARHPQSLRTLRVLILDEIHLYDQTYRGDQLRVLLRRLDRLIPQGFQKIALSATVHDPKTLGLRYLWPEFEIVSHPAPREIEYTLFQQEPTYRRLLRYLQEREARKVLYFAPTRREVEAIAMTLKRERAFQGRIWVHHGSLSKKEREATEQRMLHSRYGMIVATTTLELGIDIGDIDAVVLHSPPNSVAQLLQRIGRGNRRRPTLYAVGLYRTPLEKTVFETLFELASKGWLESVPYDPAPSVAVQQILSYALQRKRVGMPKSAVLAILEPLEMDSQSVEELLDHLTDHGLLRWVNPGLYFLGERGERMARRGEIHSNIETYPTEYEVYDIETGNRIGTVEVLAPSFVLEGQVWEVVTVRRKQAYVRRVQAIQPVGKVFKGKGAALWPASLGIQIRQKIFPGTTETTLPYVVVGNLVGFYHFFGVLYGYLWAEALKQKGIPAQDQAGRVLWTQRVQDLRTLIELPLEHLEATAVQVGPEVRKLLALGAFFRHLPRRLQDLAWIRAFHVEDLAERLWSSDPIPLSTLPTPTLPLTEI